MRKTAVSLLRSSDAAAPGLNGCYHFPATPVWVYLAVSLMLGRSMIREGSFNVLMVFEITPAGPNKM